MISWKKDDPYVGGEVGNWNFSAGSPAFSGRYYALGFVATARTITSSSSAGESNVNDDASRTATRCFMRGIKEHIRFESGTGRSYLWRRICFKFTGQEILGPNGSGLFGSMWSETSAGYVRAMTLLISGSTTDPTVWNNLVNILFKGQANVDWNDIMAAKVDNTRVHLAYDHTTRLQPKNDSGQQWKIDRWHPMNKTLIYNDDESGGSKLGTELSTNTRLSMGDYYIIDLFDMGLAPSDGDVLNVAMNSTLYWHER